MNRFAVLAEGFEHLSYPLGKLESADRQIMVERKESYMLHEAESQLSAEMALEASDWISSHASLPVGFVADEAGSVFVVSQSNSPVPPASEMSEEERKDFCRAVVRRLAALHTQGFGCGGISPEAVGFSRKEAKLLNPSAIFALTDSDSIFYEAVATLRALAGPGFAKQQELEWLSAEYVSFSPVCRHAIAGHSVGRGQLHKKLAESARKAASYF